jgi:hypothetical protein
MVITLHYVDEEWEIHYIDYEWEMRSVIIVFKRVMYPYTGERLAENLIEAVQEMSSLLLPSLR